MCFVKSISLRYKDIFYSSKGYICIFIICIRFVLAVDLNYGNIYCSVCESYVYDEEIDSIAKDEADKASQLKCRWYTQFRFIFDTS